MIHDVNVVLPRFYSLVDFISESNKIEGIFRTPTRHEIEEAERFLRLDRVTVADLEKFVSVYQPGAVLRKKVGLNVEIRKGGMVIHRPPAGAPKVVKTLEGILSAARGIASPYKTHFDYEDLHPFTDGNGRSGRMLWLWCHEGHAPNGFLHEWYYESLSAGRGQF